MFTNLLPGSLFATISQFCCVLLGGYVGGWVDRSNRLRLQQTALLIQNFAEISAFGLLIILEYNFIRTTRIDPLWKNPLFDALFFGSILLGAVAAVAGMIGSISMSKDWIVTIQRAHPYLPLTQVNSSFRRIDLLCKVLAPLVFAAVVKYGGLTLSLIIVSSWNAISMVPEFLLIRFLYKKVPKLAMPQQEALHDGSSNPFSQIVRGWRAYFSQPILRSSIASVLLYMTVLSPGGVMTAYLDFRQLSEFFIAVVNGVGALIGLLATFVAPYLIKWLSLRTTGFLALWYQWTALLLTLIPFLWPHQRAPIILLPIFVSLSRFGLWSFDLVEVQLMQTYVPDGTRCTVSGVEISLQNLLDVGANAMGIIVPDPRYFLILVIISLLFVLSAVLVYSSWHLRPPISVIEIEKALSIRGIFSTQNQETTSLLDSHSIQNYQSSSDSIVVPLKGILDANEDDNSQFPENVKIRRGLIAN